MVKIVQRKLGKYTARPKSVSVTRFRDSKSGRFVENYTIDGRSRKFGDDLTYVFSKNVAKARDENVKRFGTADGRRKK
jgi:hypothetical protein